MLSLISILHHAGSCSKKAGVQCQLKVRGLRLFLGRV